MAMSKNKIFEEGITYDKTIHNFTKTTLESKIDIEGENETVEKIKQEHYPGIISFSVLPLNGEIVPFNVWNTKQEKKIQSISYVQGLNTITLSWDKIVDLSSLIYSKLINVYIYYENNYGEELNKIYYDCILDPSYSISISNSSSIRFIFE